MGKLGWCVTKNKTSNYKELIWQLKKAVESEPRENEHQQNERVAFGGPLIAW